MLTVALSALLVLTAAVPAAGAECERSSLGALLEQLDTVRDRNDVPAYGMTLVNRERVLYCGARGIADLESGAAVDGDTRFRIGSITKAFTSLALLLAVRDGDFALDDRLVDLLDPAPLDNPWAAEVSVTLAQLLEHTSGLTDLTWPEMRHSDPAPLPLAEAVRISAPERRVRWRPAEHSSYSNAGAGLAARALEVHSDTLYERFVQERIFAPLGMITASVLLDEATAANLATGYDRDATTPIPYWHMLYRPFGAINVRPHDMAPFLRMLLNDGAVDGKPWLDRVSVRRMELPTTTLSARHGLDYGYGLGIYSWYRDGWLFHGHGGDGDGFLAHFGYSREFGMAYFVVITAFRHAPLRAMRRQLEDHIVCGKNPHRPPVATLSADSRKRLTGTYEQVTWRFGDGTDNTLEVVDEGGRLYTTTDKGVRRELVPVSERLFRRPDQPAATMAIVEDSTGTLALQGDIGNYRKR
ncbi:MAG: serine hydrolase domain-containing protein [Pseudomonadota bacterium]